MRTLRLAFLSTGALELLATISVAIVAVLCGVRLAARRRCRWSTAMLAILLAPEAYWPIRRVGQEFHSAADGAAALAEIQA
jgi:ATP-binding cassette subfamily C protein CydD